MITAFHQRGAAAWSEQIKYRNRYNQTLVPDDGTEHSDKAISHAIYLSKLSWAEIIILNVIEHVKDADSSALIATSTGRQDGSDVTNDKLEVSIYGE